jgi:ABC transport system ATP-binding/permease protein
MIPMMILSGAMFPFDKLNRSLARADRVPFIAEIMPTGGPMRRSWSNSSRATNTERVYPLKQQISISDFNTIYRIPRVDRGTGKHLKRTKGDRNHKPRKQ